MHSRLPGFYKQSIDIRHRTLIQHEVISPDDITLLQGKQLSLETANQMIENVIGTFALPLAVGVNMRLNNEDYIVPMVVEEPSIVAAVSNMARLVRKSGGFTTHSTASNMIGQVQISNVQHVDDVLSRLENSKERLYQHAKTMASGIEKYGGGLKDIYFKHVRYDEPNEPVSDMVVLHFIIDCVDAMGANIINTVAEALAPMVEEISQEEVNLRILSNYATERIATATCSIPFEHLEQGSGEDGQSIAEGIVDAYRFAYADPWRAATHNKGIMNGIDPVAIATGNDWRAIEAGAHTWAARSGQYRSLTKWSIEEGRLLGRLELPMQVGTVGGCIRNHPQVQNNLRILGNPDARRLAEIMTAVGLAQNLGALNALSTDGIQRGHMKMHARNIAVEAGATSTEIPAIVRHMCEAKSFSITTARSALENLRLVQ